MAAFDIDGDLVRRLAVLLDETGLTEIEFAEADRRIRVARTAAPVPAMAAFAQPAAAAPPSAAAGSAAAPPSGAVTAPMVGTAYLAPEPGVPPFVRPGDTVVEGQTLLIIEAMKVMNPIRAPRAGSVKKVVVKDAQPVEFGETLMIVE